jgi:hypothetical protein
MTPKQLEEFFNSGGILPEADIHPTYKARGPLLARDVATETGTSIASLVNVVSQHTTACCTMQVIDITLVKYHFRNITSLRVVHQKHSGLHSSTKYYKPQLYKGLQFLLGPNKNTCRFYINATSLNYNRKQKTKHDDLLKPLYSIVFGAA